MKDNLTTIVAEDIAELIEKLFKEKAFPKYITIRIDVFYEAFIMQYPLKYQRDDKPIIKSVDIKKIIMKMGICSTFKFKGMNRKRYKFVRGKLFHERKLYV